jgi:DNA-3-methyladenine glycosylase
MPTLLKKSLTHRLPRNFFEQDSLTVAQQLIGKVLTFRTTQGIIVETEAYCGFDDPASHAARGKTPRSAVMFGPAGFSYVYFIYGMYHCLNIVTESEGYPAAILIRGLYIPDQQLHLNGPGKLCRHLGITREHNQRDLIHEPDFYVSQTHLHLPWQATPRIGIKVGCDKLWRFVANF